MDVWYSLVTYMKTINFLPIKSQPVLEAKYTTSWFGAGFKKSSMDFFQWCFFHSTPPKKASTSHLFPVDRDRGPVNVHGARPAGFRGPPNCEGRQLG